MVKRIIQNGTNICQPSCNSVSANPIAVKCFQCESCSDILKDPYIWVSYNNYLYLRQIYGSNKTIVFFLNKQCYNFNTNDVVETDLSVITTQIYKNIIPQFNDCFECCNYSSSSSSSSNSSSSSFSSSSSSSSFSSSLSSSSSSSSSNSSSNSSSSSSSLSSSSSSSLSSSSSSSSSLSSSSSNSSSLSSSSSSSNSSFGSSSSSSSSSFQYCPTGVQCIDYAGQSIEVKNVNLCNTGGDPNGTGISYYNSGSGFMMVSVGEVLIYIGCDPIIGWHLSTWEGTTDPCANCLDLILGFGNSSCELPTGTWAWCGGTITIS